MTECTIQSAVATFLQVRGLIADSLGSASATALVSAVLSGAVARRGTCKNGWEYFVHGVGYTVVTAAGGQVHIDGSDAGDVFSVYDIRFYLDGIGCAVPSVDMIRRECDRLEASRSIERVDEIRYALLPTYLDISAENE
jgi:hypothetical protein